MFNFRSSMFDLRLLSVLVALMMGVPAFALTPAVLVTRELETREVSLSSLHDGVMTFFDHSRSLRREPIDQFVQVRSIGGDVVLPAREAAVAVLTDGQRIVGEWAGATHDGQKIRWMHSTLGEYLLPLDRIATITWQGEVDLIEAVLDRVVLRNGDAVTGFIEQITDDAIAITPDQTDDIVMLAIDRVASVTLANPDLSPRLCRYVVALADGSRLETLEMTIAGDAARVLTTLGSEQGQRVMPIDELVRIDVTTSGYRLVDLTSLPMRIKRAADVFGLIYEPSVADQTLRVHAPASVSYDLPDGADRLSASAQLDAPKLYEPRPLGWAEFELVVSVEGEELGRWRIDADHPRAELNVELPRLGRELTLELDPSVNGPVLDRLRLNNAVLLVRPESDGGSYP